MTSCDKLCLPEFHMQINLHLGFIKIKELKLPNTLSTACKMVFVGKRTR